MLTSFYYFRLLHDAKLEETSKRRYSRRIITSTDTRKDLGLSKATFSNDAYEY